MIWSHYFREDRGEEIMIFIVEVEGVFIGIHIQRCSDLKVNVLFDRIGLR